MLQSNMLIRPAPRYALARDEHTLLAVKRSGNDLLAFWQVTARCPNLVAGKQRKIHRLPGLPKSRLLTTIRFSQLCKFFHTRFGQPQLFILEKFLQCRPAYLLSLQ